LFSYKINIIQLYRKMCKNKKRKIYNYLKSHCNVKRKISVYFTTFKCYRDESNDVLKSIF